jgi:hypothetical protein
MDQLSPPSIDAKKRKAGEELVEKLEKSLDAMKQNIKEGKEWSATYATWNFCDALTKYSLEAEFKTLDVDCKPFANVKWLRGRSSRDNGDHACDEIALSFDIPHEGGSRSLYSIEVFHVWQVDGEFDDAADPDKTSVVGIGRAPSAGPWRHITGIPDDTEAFAKLLFSVIIHASPATGRLTYSHVQNAIQSAIHEYIVNDGE